MKTIVLILLTFSLNAQESLLKKAEGQIKASKILLATGAIGLTGSVLYWHNPPKPPNLNTGQTYEQSSKIFADYSRRFKNYQMNRVIFISASGAMILASGFMAMSGNLQKEIYNAGKYTVGLTPKGINISF